MSDINIRQENFNVSSLYEVDNDVLSVIMKKVLNFLGEIGYELRDQIIFRRSLEDHEKIISI